MRSSTSHRPFLWSTLCANSGWGHLGRFSYKYPTDHHTAKLCSGRQNRQARKGNTQFRSPRLSRDWFSASDVNLASGYNLGDESRLAHNGILAGLDRPLQHPHCWMFCWCIQNTKSTERRQRDLEATRCITLSHSLIMQGVNRIIRAKPVQKGIIAYFWQLMN